MLEIFSLETFVVTISAIDSLNLSLDCNPRIIIAKVIGLNRVQYECHMNFGYWRLSLASVSFECNCIYAESFEILFFSSCKNFQKISNFVFSQINSRFPVCDCSNLWSSINQMVSQSEQSEIG